jgi:hypothetical protein
MSLSELKELEREAINMDAGSKRYSDAAEQLQRFRNDSRSMSDILKSISSHPHSYTEASKALFEVIEESKVDLLRLTELRLIALSRDFKVKASQRRAVLAACILPVPELKKGGDV